MADQAGSIVVYGALWCPDCRRSKKFLSEQKVPFTWVDIEQDEAARALVESHNNGKRIIPTIVFEDGAVLVEPSNAQLAQKLGLQTRPQRTVYDLVVIGAGPGGLTAALYAAREGVQTLVIERSAIGGQASITATIENFPGFPEPISGGEFAERLGKQARRFGVEISQAQDVQRITPDGMGCHTVELSDGSSVTAYAVLVASGASYRRLDVPGEEDFIGAGVHFCATCDGPFYKGSDNITVIGGGNSAVEESLHLLKFTDRVNMLVRGPELTAGKTAVDSVLTESRVQVNFNSQVKALKGAASKLTHVVYTDGDGTERELATSAAFVFIGQQPNTAFVNGLVRTDERGFIITGHDLLHTGETLARAPFPMETSVPGIFAAGDCRMGSTKQVASAVGEGASAAIAIRDYLKTI
ncbi:MAG: FAD-dependent oxidoreductase [Anaerolineae bacterium]|nr:FAD-dependent oxidoreductase [Anaerolineae bacterium]